MLLRALAWPLLALLVTPAVALPIHEIQGAGLVSPLLGQVVTTGGIVTAVDSRGFYLQDPEGDDDPATSEGIFVYAAREPSVRAGDEVLVTGRVLEYSSPFVPVPGRPTATEIGPAWPEPLVVDVRSSGRAVPAPVVVGASGRLPPTQTVRPDGRAFWESLEGMLVTIEDAAAVAPRRGTGELAIVANRGATATGRNAAGGLTIGPGDDQPEWVLVRRDPGLADVTVPFADVGDLLGDVTGVVDQSVSAYQVLATRPLSHSGGGGAPAPAATPVAPGVFRIASYNLRNLGPDSTRTRFEAIARQIVEALHAPHVLALQEILDDDGAPSGRLTEAEAGALSSVVSADLTTSRLVDAIVAAGGPRYVVAQVDPEDDRDGGVPGGNIRVVFLVDPVRVVLAAPVSRLPGSEDSPGPFDDARKPLVGEFSFRGRSIRVINAHLSSRHGSVPLYGQGEPTVAGRAEREAQARFLREAVDRYLRADPGTGIVVLGDLNAHGFESPLAILEGNGSLRNLAAALDPVERYSYIHGGGSQQLDHALVSPGLADRDRIGFEIVHLNVAFHGSPSDHDPILVSLWVPEPPAAVLLGGALLVLVVAASIRARRLPVSGSA